MGDTSYDARNSPNSPMILISAWRILKFALQNISRNVWLAFTTLAIISVSLFAISSLYLLNIVANEAIQAIKEKVDISLYFKPEVSREQILKIERDLTADDEVRDVIYISKEESIDKLRQRFKGNPTIIESLAELEANPLGDILIVKAKNTEDYQTILDKIDGKRAYAQLIQYKNFDDNRAIIARITDLADKVKRAALAVSAIFLIIVVSVLVNSLRVTIYSHREEIAIMRLVGATNWFIRGPFLVEMILYVLLSSVITGALLFPIISALDPHIASLFGGYHFELSVFYARNVLRMWAYLFLGTCFISIVSSSIAMRRYLRV